MAKANRTFRQLAPVQNKVEKPVIVLFMCSLTVRQNIGSVMATKN